MATTENTKQDRGNRLIEVTAGNLRNSHIYITGIHDFFPRDAYGRGAREAGLGRPIAIELDGLAKTVSTDIPCDVRTGRPRRYFRARAWVREFFEHHAVAAGDVLSLECSGERTYRLSLIKRNGDSRTFLEFFAGIGLVRMGLEAVGWTLVYANDIDPIKREMYDAHFGDAHEHFRLEDIHKMSSRDLPDAALATASFPCTDMSLAGGRKGFRGRESSAFFGLIRVLEEMGDRRPPIVLLENVVAFLTSHGGADFESAMLALNKLGYWVDPFVLDAKWFMPQSRPRLFVVASRLPNEESVEPLGLIWPSRLRPKLLSQYIISYSDIRWSLRSLPEPPEQAAVLDCTEFFAGIGLVRLALERQGWHVVFANDIAPKKAEMYRHNWPKNDHLVVGGIHALKADGLPSCTLFAASFPCNDLSIAGRWEGLHGKESSSFWGLMQIIRDMGQRRPPLVMLENVVGFLMSHGGRDFEQALLALNELGYTVDAIILNAIHWVPQSRPRLFVLAKRDEGQETRSCALVSDARLKSLLGFINGHPNIRWDIRDVPPLPPPRARLVDIIEDLPDDDPHWWDQKRADYFMNQMSTKHEEQARKMIAGKSYTNATVFRRVRYEKSMAELRTDGIAGSRDMHWCHRLGMGCRFTQRSAWRLPRHA